MRISAAAFRPLAIGLVAAFLGSCGAQSGGTLPQWANAQNLVHRVSGSYGDLVYLSDGTSVYVYTYPQNELVGTLSGVHGPWGMCTDTSGNVFVTNSEEDDITEYAHGEMAPIAMLPDSPYSPQSCAVDPISGNLAVANPEISIYTYGNVAIYKGAKGQPAFYALLNSRSPTFCTYDGHGNLFADGEGNGLILGEMAEGSYNFSAISLNDKSLWNPGSLQWDGKYLTLVSSQSNKGPLPVYRVKISGSAGAIIKKTTLRSSKLNRNSFYDQVQYWIQGNVIIGQNGRRTSGVGFWRYPAGGKPFAVLDKPYDELGAVVSVAPSGSRIHR